MPEILPFPQYDSHVVEWELMNEAQAELRRAAEYDAIAKEQRGMSLEAWEQLTDELCF